MSSFIFLCNDKKTFMNQCKTLYFDLSSDMFLSNVGVQKINDIRKTGFILDRPERKLSNNGIEVRVDLLRVPVVPKQRKRVSEAGNGSGSWGGASSVCKDSPPLVLEFSFSSKKRKGRLTPGYNHNK